MESSDAQNLPDFRGFGRFNVLDGLPTMTDLMLFDVRHDDATEKLSLGEYYRLMDIAENFFCR